MKTILFLSYDLPYPLDAGGKIRAYHLIEQLSKKYAVRLLYFYRNARNESYEKHLRPFCRDISAFKRRPVNSLANVRYLRKIPFPAALYLDPYVTNRIQEEVKKGIDAIHYESFYTSIYISEHISVPQILGTENIEWRVYKNYATVEKNPFMRAFFNFETGRIRRYELATWHRADRCLAVSPENVSEIQKSTEKPVDLVKNGVDTDYFTPAQKNGDSTTLLFVGNFNYIQNTDAVDYLLSDIVSHIPSQFSLRLVGRNPTPEIAAHLSRAQKTSTCTILLDAGVDDIRDAYNEAFILLAPLRIGSGTKFKILEALASGIPVVATKLAVEGMGIAHEQHALIADSPREIASAVQRLSKDKKMYEKLAKNGRALIESMYSWDAIGDNLRNIYEKTFDHHR